MLHKELKNGARRIVSMLERTWHGFEIMCQFDREQRRSECIPGGGQSLQPPVDVHVHVRAVPRSSAASCRMSCTNMTRSRVRKTERGCARAV